MKRRKIYGVIGLILIILFAMSLILTSCDDSTDVDTSTHQYKRAEISNQPGFLWVDAKAGTYQPNQDTINLLKSAFNSKEQKIVFYAKQACSCDPSQYPFPHSLKIMDLMGLTDSNCEIYSIYSTKSDNPYKISGLIINAIPSIFIYKNNVPVYSVVDSVTASVGTLSLEQAFLNGLRK